MARRTSVKGEAEKHEAARDIELLKPSEVAALIGVDERTLANWRSLGKGPRFFKPTGKKVLYSREAIRAFLTRIEAQSGREARSKLAKLRS